MQCYKKCKEGGDVSEMVAAAAAAKAKKDAEAAAVQKLCDAGTCKCWKVHDQSDPGKREKWLAEVEKFNEENKAKGCVEAYMKCADNACCNKYAGGGKWKSCRGAVGKNAAAKKA